MVRSPGEVAVGFAKMGDKFPEELKKARARDALGVELKKTQNSAKSGDKNHEPEDTGSTTPREGKTMANENTQQQQSTQSQSQTTEERVIAALERLAHTGVRIEVSGPEDYSMAATALKGAAVGGVVGGLAAGLGVGLGVDGATPALVIGASTAGAAGGGVLGAAVAVTIWDGKPSKKSDKK